jgi:hypothetical protein
MTDSIQTLLDSLRTARDASSAMCALTSHLDTAATRHPRLPQLVLSGTAERLAAALSTPPSVALPLLSAAFARQPFADVAFTVAWLAADAGLARDFAADSASLLHLLQVVAPRCAKPRQLFLLLARALKAAAPAVCGTLVAAVRLTLQNPRTRIELAIELLVQPLMLQLEESPDAVRVQLLAVVLADVARDERFVAQLATARSLPHFLCQQVLQADAQQPQKAAALLQLAPALFSCIVDPLLERQSAPRPPGVASMHSDACAARNAGALAAHAKEVISLARTLLRAGVAALDALGTDMRSADRCVGALAGVLSRVALTGTYLPNGALDECIETATVSVLGSSASLDRKGDFFVVLLSFNVRFVLERRRALFAQLWSTAADARSRTEPLGATVQALRLYDEQFGAATLAALDGAVELDADRCGARGLLTGLIEASARARQLPEALGDILHCLATTAKASQALFGAEWLNALVTRAYRAVSPAQATQILVDMTTALRENAFFALHGAGASKPGFAAGWSLVARVVIGAIHVAPTRRHEVHLELVALWRDWLSPALKATDAERAPLPALAALSNACVWLASTLGRCETLLEGDGGDEADIAAAAAAAHGAVEPLAVAVASTVARSALAARLQRELASGDGDVATAAALLDLWALLTRLAPELESVVDVRACVELGDESLWRTAVHHIGALARRTDSGAVLTLLVDAALPVPVRAGGEKRKKSKRAAATATPSAACAAALSEHYAVQLPQVREPLCGALLARLVRAVGDDAEYSSVARTVRKLGEAVDADDAAAAVFARLEKSAKGDDGAADGDAATAGDVIAVLGALTRLPTLFWPAKQALVAAAIAVSLCRWQPSHGAARALLAQLPDAAVADVIEAPSVLQALSADGGVLTSDAALLTRVCGALIARVQLKRSRERSLATLQALAPLCERADAVGLNALRCFMTAMRGTGAAHTRVGALFTRLIGAAVRAVDAPLPPDAVASLCGAVAAALLCFDAASSASASPALAPAELVDAASTLVQRLIGAADASDVGDGAALVDLSLASIRSVRPVDGDAVTPAALRAIELLCGAAYDQEQMQPLLRSGQTRPVVRALVRALARAVGHSRAGADSASKALGFLTDLLLDLGYANRSAVLFGGVKNELLLALSAASSDLVHRRQMAACAAPLRCFEAMFSDDKLTLSTVQAASMLRSANLIASVSTPLSLATLEHACRVLLAALRRRDEATRDLNELETLLLRTLMARTFEANSVGGGGADVLAATDAFVRVLAQVASVDNRKLFQHHVVYIGSDYLTWLDRVAVRHDESRALLARGMFYVFDVCNKPTMQLMYTAASSVGKQRLKQLHEQYEREHKFKGVV